MKNTNWIWSSTGRSVCGFLAWFSLFFLAQCTYEFIHCQVNQDCPKNDQICLQGVCCSPTENPESDCQDRMDNDCDGLIDCQDADCADRPCDDGRPETFNDLCRQGSCLGSTLESRDGGESQLADATNGSDLPGRDEPNRFDENPEISGNDETAVVGDELMEVAMDRADSAPDLIDLQNFDLEGSDLDAPDPDEAACIEFSNGMVITSNTRLCPGTHSVALAPGSAAISIAADDVSLTCVETVLQGASEWGTIEQPTVGIRIGARSRVHVQGCAAHGFRYGLSAQGSLSLILEQVNLDDNYTDPNLAWVHDEIQGGGLRLDGVIGGIVRNSSLARNWNAIEVRNCSQLTITSNLADHCSNSGALLINSTSNTLAGNNFSWAIRGENLSYPSNWYGASTRDSAGIILDAASSDNQLLNNDCTFGGDGIFLRQVFGSCAERNLIEGNNASFSPNNAIESWCDETIIRANQANDSNYGIWTGGMDRGQILGNQAMRNRVDGISIQITEDRHTLIEGNTISGNGRAGLLLTGREIQSWNELDYVGPDLANSSHILVQGNQFDGNGQTDIFIASSRLVLMLSNCGTDAANPSILYGLEADLALVEGSCGGELNLTPPSAFLSVPSQAVLHQNITLDASGSKPGSSGEALHYLWALQPAGMRFVSGVLPPADFKGEGLAIETHPVSRPGFVDALVFVHDGHLGSLADGQILILPNGVRIGESATDWSYFCVEAPGCLTSFSEEAGLEGNAVRIDTNAPFEFAAITPKNRNLGLPLSGVSHIGFFVQSENSNDSGWQGKFPVVKLGGPQGLVSYTPSSNLLTVQRTEWIFVSIPLAGGEGWAREGPGLTRVDWLEIHSDTWGGIPYTLWLDTVSFFSP